MWLSPNLKVFIKSANGLSCHREILCVFNAIHKFNQTQKRKRLFPQKIPAIDGSKMSVLLLTVNCCAHVLCRVIHYIVCAVNLLEHLSSTHCIEA